METNLSKKEFNCFKEVCSTVFDCEETAEAVVTDMLPDISMIIDTGGMIFIKSKELEQGRVTVSATLNASVLYSPEDECGLRSIPMSVPVSMTIDAPEADDKCRCTAVISITSLEARMLNPRKVLLRAQLRCTLKCYRQENIALFCGLEENSPANDSLHLLINPIEMTVCSDIREKTFVIADEYRFSASSVFTSILSQNAKIYTEDVKTVGNKLIFKGTAAVSLICAGEDFEPAKVEFSSVFSQIIELDSTTEGAGAEMRLMCTGAYFELIRNADGGLSVSAELHMAAQAVGYAIVTGEYISDAYSNVLDTQLTHSELAVTCFRRAVTLRESVKAVCEANGTVSEIVCANVSHGAPEYNGSELVIPVNVNAIYKNDQGKCCFVFKRLSFTAAPELEHGASAEICDIRFSDVYVSAVSGSLEIRAPMEIHLLTSLSKVINMVSALDVGERTSTENHPSVVIIKTQRGSRLWTLAKKYHSTPELIAEVNGLETDEDLPERILLIPKSK